MEKLIKNPTIGDFNIIPSVVRWERKIIIELARQLYSDYPWWKRRKIFNFYHTNNWDVTGEWEKCVRHARRMIGEANYLLENHVKEGKVGE